MRKIEAKISKYGIGVLLVPLFFLFILGCEEKDETPPQVSLTSPSEGQSFTAGDTLVVSGQASDNENIKRLSIRLTTPEGVAAAQNINLHPTSNPYGFTTSYVIDNLDLATGTYQMAVTAGDGEQKSSQFIPIQVYALPLALQRTVVVTSNTDETHAYSLEDGDFQSLFSYASEVTGARVSSYANTLAICGGTSGKLEFRSSVTGELLTSYQNNSAGGTPWFLNLSYYEPQRRFAVSVSNQEVRFYNELGGDIGTLVTRNEFYPYRVWFDDDRFFVDERSITAPTVRLNFYQRPGGVFEQQIGFPNPIMAFYSLPLGEKLMFFNSQNNQGQVRLIAQGSTLAGTPAQLPAGKLKAVTHLQNDSYVLSIDGSIYRYTYSSSQFQPIANWEAEILVYDRAGGTLMAAEGDQISYLNPVSGGILQTLQAPGEVRYILPDYNR